MYPTGMHSCFYACLSVHRGVVPEPPGPNTPPPDQNPPPPVADLGIPRGGGANSPGGCQHTISPKFPKNCMKLKEFGPPCGETRPKFYYVDPPLPPGAIPPETIPPGTRHPPPEPQKRAARIILECFLVSICTEKLIGEKLEATEVSQSEIGQKQKLRVVLDKINRILNLPPHWSHAKWSVDSKSLPSIIITICIASALKRVVQSCKIYISEVTFTIRVHALPEQNSKE